jgi:hypothetical protein
MAAGTGRCLHMAAGTGRCLHMVDRLEHAPLRMNHSSEDEKSTSVLHRNNLLS